LLSSFAAAGEHTVTLCQARDILGPEGDAAAQVLHRLAAKGWLARLQRGTYRVIPLEAGPEGSWAAHEYLVAASLVSPYYLAYATALYYHGYTERRPGQVWIATTRRKRPRTVEGVRYRFVTLGSKFFGYTEQPLLDASIFVAEREKAIADGFDHPEYCGGVIEPAKGLWYGSDEIDLGKTIGYSRRLGNRSATRRLGFWLELLGAADNAVLGQLEMPGNRNYARLDPSGPPTGPRNARWRLIVNIPESQLLEWREY
jgi:predicted transcriptional regulator of viral defense system